MPADNTNGITFSHDYRTLYVSTCGGHGAGSYRGDVYRIPIEEDGSAGDTVRIGEVPLDSHANGTTMDACGNLYIVASVGVIYRLSPDEVWEVVVDFRGAGDVNISSINFGSGIGGWKSDSIYISPYENSGFYEVDVGIPGKK